MSTFLGIDIGTSAVKAVLVDERQRAMAEAEVPLSISRPVPDAAEQDAEAWWTAAEAALASLRREAPAGFAAVAGIGLSGQMHAALLLDEADRPLRPAMLWNDGRAVREAEALAADAALARIAGVLPMPGFTAPKLMWLARREPDVVRAARSLLLPKDYIRLKLTGERATDLSDAAGTWWLDEAARAWSPAALAASGTDPALLPRLVEGSAASGRLRPQVAASLGLPAGIVVAGGAGDAAAGAIGLGAVADGDAFLSLGTSSQLFATTADFRPAPETLVHAFCHGLPDRWFQMAAMLNGASCLAFASALLSAPITTLLADAEAAWRGPSDLLFLPYLSGERTPHNDPDARGVVFGLTPAHGRAEVALAVLEGVAFSFADAQRCLASAGTPLAAAGVVGGGARSAFWTRILAAVLGLPLTRYVGSDKGPAFGAARLGRLAATGESAAAVATPPPILDVSEPDRALGERYAPRLEAFRGLYRALAGEFGASRRS